MSIEYRVVPYEPTLEMKRAGLSDRHDDLSRSIYRAMLDAAPMPATGGEPRHLTEPEIMEFDQNSIMQIEFAQAIESEVRGRYHAHVTRLQAEVDLLKGRELGVKHEVFEIVCTERDALKRENNVLDILCEQRFNEIAGLQSELTKAREVIERTASDYEDILKALTSFNRGNKQAWCGYLDDSLGICQYRLKEITSYLARQSAPTAKDDDQ